MPLDSNITIDTGLTDNAGRWYKVPCVYEYLAASRTVREGMGVGPLAIRQELEVGPLSHRARWLAIRVTVYGRRLKRAEPETYTLSPVTALDFGRHALPMPGPAAPKESVIVHGYPVPVYPGAQQIEVDEAVASYVVPGLPYPSDDVIGFYNEWALWNGWIRTGSVTGTWSEFLDSTTKPEEHVYQVGAQWERKGSAQVLSVSALYRRRWAKGSGAEDAGWEQNQTVYVSVGECGDSGAVE